MRILPGVCTFFFWCFVEVLEGEGVWRGAFEGGGGGFGGVFLRGEGVWRGVFKGGSLEGCFEGGSLEGCF